MYRQKYFDKQHADSGAWETMSLRCHGSCTILALPFSSDAHTWDIHSEHRYTQECAAKAA